MRKLTKKEIREQAGNGDKTCSVQNSEGFYCTLKKGHIGNHLACGNDPTFCWEEWENKDETSETLAD